MKNIFNGIKEKISSTKTFFKETPQKIKKHWPAFKEWAMSTEGIIYGTIAVVVIFIILMVVQACTPRKGSFLYGICGSFLELQIPYPETIRHSSVEQYRKALRIYYSHIDDFGEYQMEMLECSFYMDETERVFLERVYFSHIKDITKKKRAPGKGRLYEVEQEHIDLFNKSFSAEAIMLQEPDLTLPGY